MNGTSGMQAASSGKFKIANSESGSSNDYSMSGNFAFSSFSVSSSSSKSMSLILASKNELMGSFGCGLNLSLFSEFPFRLVCLMSFLCFN